MKLLPDRLDRTALHVELDRFLDDADRHFYDEGDERERSSWAVTLMSGLMSLSRKIAGPGLLEGAYPLPCPASSDKDRLTELARRMQPLAWLLKDQSAGEHSIDSVIIEIKAIAEGDAPKIFAKRNPVKGRRLNSYLLALQQASAFQWDEILKIMNVSVAQRQSYITNAFGVTWDAIMKWRSPVASLLGEQEFERHLYWARVGGRLSSPHDMEKCLAELSAAGDAYKRELRSGMSPAGQE